VINVGDIDHVLINGYHFGDRLLEGVYFKVTIKDEEFKVVLAEGEEHYCKQLDMKHWVKEGHEFVKDYDIGECPHCREDVALEDYDPETAPTIVDTPAKAFSLGELLTKAKEEIDERGKDEETGNSTE